MDPRILYILLISVELLDTPAKATYKYLKVGTYIYDKYGYFIYEQRKT